MTSTAPSRPEADLERQRQRADRALCGEASQRPSRRRPCRGQAAGSARSLPRRARLSGERRAAPEAHRCPSRSDRLPDRPHDHRRWSDDGPRARPRSSRTDACLAGRAAGSSQIDEVFLMNWRSENSLDGRYFGPLSSIDHRRPRRSRSGLRRTTDMPAALSSTAPRLCNAERLHSSSVPAMSPAAVCSTDEPLKVVWRLCLSSSAVGRSARRRQRPRTPTITAFRQCHRCGGSTSRTS